MPESILTQATINNAAPGTRAIASFNPPDGIVAARFAFTRAQLSDTIQISLSLDLSQNSGATWLPLCAASFVGGVALDAGGQPFVESFFKVPLPGPSTASTRVRGSVTFNERLTTTATIYGETP